MILLLHERGITVRVVTDRDYMTITGSQIGNLRRAGVLFQLTYRGTNS